MQEATEEFKTSPLATKVIGGLATILIGIFCWWCVRVTSQLDALLTSSAANEKVAETVKEQGQHISQLYVNYNLLDKKSVLVDKLDEDMKIVKGILFKKEDKWRP